MRISTPAIIDETLPPHTVHSTVLQQFPQISHINVSTTFCLQHKSKRKKNDFYIAHKQLEFGHHVAENKRYKGEKTW